MPTLLDSADLEALEKDQTAFNVAVWERLQKDTTLAALPYRIETDRYGQMIMSPPPAPSHGSFQGMICHLLYNLGENGRPLTECPVSTSDGVKAADVAWSSDEIWNSLEGKSCFTRCPEILVEVISPSNTKAEIRDKTALYFEAGAKEVWLCSKEGKMSFFSGPAERLRASELIPDFPANLPE